MAGAQEKLDMVLAQQRQNAAAHERIEDGAAAIEQAQAQIRAFVKEADELRMTMRLNYNDLTEAIKTEVQRRSLFYTWLDRFATATFAVLVWTVVLYLLERFR